eukprot:gene1495-biopygen13872
MKKYAWVPVDEFEGLECEHCGTHYDMTVPLHEGYVCIWCKQNEGTTLMKFHKEIAEFTQQQHVDLCLSHATWCSKCKLIHMKQGGWHGIDGHGMWIAKCSCTNRPTK